jgi:hypothetical protein
VPQSQLTIYGYKKLRGAKNMAAMMQPAKEKPDLFASYVPIFHWLPLYNKAWLTGDIIAGPPWRRPSVL